MTRSISAVGGGKRPHFGATARWWPAIGTTLALALISLLPSPASAAAPASFSVTPKAPRDSQAIKVAWRPSGLRGKASYRFEARTGDGNTCESFRSVPVGAAWRRGATVRATLRPTADKRYWCPGPARVRVIRTKGRSTTVIELLTIVIGDDASTENPGPFGNPAKVTLLEGSTMTVRVAGRPDRSSALSGELRGHIPGRFKPRTDIQITLTRGSVSATSLPTDPACASAGRQYPTPLGLVTTPAPYSKSTLLFRQTMTVLASGRASLGLTLDQDHVAALTGCKSAGSDTKSYALGFAGDVGPTGLVRLTISGGTDGLKLSDGATASVVFTLVLNIDLSGK